jgi:hypothetical protein
MSGALQPLLHTPLWLAQGQYTYVFDFVSNALTCWQFGNTSSYEH